jgi:HlyD family secretion protein
VDAYPQRVFGGKVAQVRMAPQVFQNVVTYMVVIEAENSDQALFPGMTALVRVAVSELEDVLKVPNAALRFRPRSELAETARTSVSADSATVWVLVEGKAKPVEVTTGESDGSAIAVLDGDLEPGDQVILGAVRAGS